MKTFYKLLIGFTTSIIVMFVYLLIINILEIEKNDFFVGWISCMGFLISTNYFDKWVNRKANLNQQITPTTHDIINASIKNIKKNTKDYTPFYVKYFDGEKWIEYKKD